MDISERLQDLRKKSKYSQEEVADILGISRQAVSKWESGQGKPEIENIIKLADIYNVSTDFLLLGKDSKMAIPAKEKEKLSPTVQRTICAIAIIGATALVTVLFIASLWLLTKIF